MPQERKEFSKKKKEKPEIRLWLFKQVYWKKNKEI